MGGQIITRPTLKNVSFTIGPTGNFTDIETAWDYLLRFHLSSEVRLVIQDGHTASFRNLPFHPDSPETVIIPATDPGSIVDRANLLSRRQTGEDLLGSDLTIANTTNSPVISGHYSSVLSIDDNFNLNGNTVKARGLLIDSNIINTSDLEATRIFSELILDRCELFNVANRSILLYGNISLNADTSRNLLQTIGNPGIVTRVRNNTQGFPLSPSITMGDMLNCSGARLDNGTGFYMRGRTWESSSRFNYVILSSQTQLFRGLDIDISQSLFLDNRYNWDLMYLGRGSKLKAESTRFENNISTGGGNATMRLSGVLASIQNSEYDNTGQPVSANASSIVHASNLLISNPRTTTQFSVSTGAKIHLQNTNTTQPMTPAFGVVDADGSQINN